MNKYSDVELNDLITAGKDATIQLSFIKSKKEARRIKELLVFRRSKLSLIRIRARELNLTETDLNDIYGYIHEKSFD